MIREYQCTGKTFIDKNTLIIGEPNTGKSFIVRDLLFMIKGLVDQIVIFAPTDPQNNLYSSIVPAPCIHYSITNDTLTNIWDRQVALVDLYNKANNIQTLRSLFEKSLQLSNKRDQYLSAIEKIDKIKQENIDKQDIDNTCNKHYANVYKKSISEVANLLSDNDLTSEEQYSLRMIDFNPKIVIVFDDCTDLLSKLKNNTIIQRIFNQGRWPQITTIISCHTDKALTPEMKKCAFCTIFTGAKTAEGYFSRNSNNFNRDEQKNILEIIKTTFTGYQKLVFDRDSVEKYYKYTASARNSFNFYSDRLLEYFNTISTSKNSIVHNRFTVEFGKIV